MRGSGPVVAALLAAGALVRLAVVDQTRLSGDDATVALIAKHVLTGEDLPVFFYRQTYMGSLNGIHLVPLLALFGPSVWLVRLGAVLYSLVFLLGLYLLGRRLFDEATARAALLVGAVPPFLLTYWSVVAEPHFETNTFGVLLLLLAVAALDAGPGPRATRVLAVFGLTAGLAFWTNFKVVELLGPALLVLWLRDPRLPVRPAGPALAAGFALGSLPVWLFYATRGDAPGHAGRLFEGQLDWSWDRLSRLVLDLVPNLLGTYYWEPAGPVRPWALRLTLLAYAAGVVALAAAALRRDPDAGGPGRAPGRRLLVLTLLAPFALVYASRLVGTFDRDTGRYLLPAYIPLLLAAGLLVGRLWRWRRTAAVLVAAWLVAFDLWTTYDFVWLLHPRQRAERLGYVREREAVLDHLRRARVDVVLTDRNFAALEWAFLLDRPRVADLSTEIYLPSAVAADAAARVGILVERATDDVAYQLGWLGGAFRTTRFGPWRFYDEIRLPGRVERAIPREGWRAEGEGGPPGAAPAAPGPPAVADGDLATALPLEPAVRGRPAVLTIDLGATHPVARVVWWVPTELQETFPIGVLTSADGQAWTPLGFAPSWERRTALAAAGRPIFRPRNGWLELRAAPRPARFLRFLPLDPASEGPWGVAELYVYADAGPAPAADPGPPGSPLDPVALGARLRALGVRRLLADPVTSARIALATGDSATGSVRTLVANGVLDSHGAAWPPARLTEAVRLTPTDALLVEAEDAPDLESRLAAHGLAFRAEPVGGPVLVHGIAPALPGLPCRRISWRAAPEPVPPAGSTGLASRTGVRIELRLGDLRRVRGLHLEHPRVATRGQPLPRVLASEDGRAWRALDDLRRIPPWHWAGRTLLAFGDQAQDLVWPPTRARALAVLLDLPAAGPGAVTSLCLWSEPPGPAADAPTGEEGSPGTTRTGSAP